MHIITCSRAWHQRKRCIAETARTLSCELTKRQTHATEGREAAQPNIKQLLHRGERRLVGGILGRYENADSVSGEGALATQADVLKILSELYASGQTTVRASTLASGLWPEQRQHNANGQVFPLGAAVAARMLRRCAAVLETEPRCWEILPHRLSGETVDQRGK